MALVMRSPSQEVATLTLKDCPICFGAVENPVEMPCCKNDFCAACLARYVEFEVAEGAVELRCPMCKRAMDATGSGVQAALDANRERRALVATAEADCFATFARSEGVMAACEDCMELLTESPAHASVCMCPRADCECSALALPRFVFSEWVHKFGESSQFVSWASTHTQPCPHCKTLIEKNEGCPNMTCGICRKHFVWRDPPYLLAPETLADLRIQAEGTTWEPPLAGMFGDD